MTKEEFERLLSPHLPAAFGLATRLLQNRDDAADLVQEATINAFSGRHTFSEGTHFKAWYFKILMNLYFRKGKKKALAEVELDEGQDAAIYRHARQSGNIPEGDPSEAFLGQVDRESVQHALEQLPTDYREVCVLYFVSELTYDEISKTVGVPVGTVRSRLHRGRKHLQRALWSLAQERGIVTGGLVSG